MTSLAYTLSIDQNACTHFHCGYTIILCHVSLKIFTCTTSHLLLHVFAQARPTMPCISLVILISSFKHNNQRLVSFPDPLASPKSREKEVWWEPSLVTRPHGKLACGLGTRLVGAIVGMATPTAPWDYTIYYVPGM